MENETKEVKEPIRFEAKIESKLLVAISKIFASSGQLCEDYPLSLETDDFKVILAPRVEN